MRKHNDQYTRFFNERIEMWDYFFACMKSRGLTWSLPVSIILLFVGGVFLDFFESALTSTEAVAQGYPPFPSSWEVGVFNHGSFFQWYIAENHPILYIASWIMFLGSFLFMLALILISSIDWLLYQYRKPDTH